MCNKFDFLPNDDTDMTMEQIHKFCDQVTAKGKRYLGKLSILGGEPLLHPKFAEVVDVLAFRLKKERLVDAIWLATNGDLLSGVHPRTLEHVYTKVSWTKASHYQMLAAPKDMEQRQRNCPVPRHCGIALNVWGYWPCGPAGALCRMFNMPQFQRMELPDKLDEFGQRDRLQNWPDICGLCQHSAFRRMRVSRGLEITKSFADKIEEYENGLKPPELERF